MTTTASVRTKPAVALKSAGCGWGASGGAACGLPPLQHAPCRRSRPRGRRAAATATATWTGERRGVSMRGATPRQQRRKAYRLGAHVLRLLGRRAVDDLLAAHRHHLQHTAHASERVQHQNKAETTPANTDLEDDSGALEGFAVGALAQLAHRRGALLASLGGALARLRRLQPAL